MRTGAAVGFLLVWGLGTLWSEPPIESAVLDFRHTLGFSLPTLNPTISAACASRAQVLAGTGVLAHGDEQGRGPGVQMLAFGFPPGEYGEILGSGARWDEVWKAWLVSRPHRDVLATEGWTQWGWGRVDSGATTVWVVRFYRP